MSKLALKDMEIDSVFSHYLMASWLYYERKLVPPWGDAKFDLACLRLAKEWDTITHPHKSLTSVDVLRCQTGFDITYPTMVKHSAMAWYKEK